MANYDTKVRVKADVENSDLSKLQKDFDKLEAKLESLYAKGEKLEALGVDKQSKQWKSLVYDVAQTENALEDVREKITEINANTSVKGFEKLKQAAGKFFGVVQDGTKKSNGLLKTLVSRFKGIALSLLVFNWITKGFNAMVRAMKEGFQNLAQYSNEYNESMSALKSQTAQFKNGLATAFEPIANIIIPYLTRLVSWLNTAADATAQFFAAMQGKTTYTRAKKQVVDYAKSLDTASKSAKKALASFDELNVLNKNDNNANQSGVMTGADAFEEAQINPGIYDALERVKGLLEIIHPLAIAIGVAFLAWKITKLLDNLGVVIKNGKEIMGFLGFIAGLALAIYEYFSMWKDGVDWEGIKGYVAGVALAVTSLYFLLGPFAAGIGLIVSGVAGLVLAFKDMTQNGVNAENMTLALISAVGILAGVFIAFGGPAAAIVAGIMAVVAQVAAFVIAADNGKEALTTLKSMCKNFADFIKKIFSGDIKSAFDSLENCLRDFANVFIIIIESIANCVINGLNLLIEKINSISFSIPDWVPGLGGKTMSPSLKLLEEVHIPRLAEGAVIQGGRPFAAILGDQRIGQTNIETPLKTMVDAFKIAMAETGGAHGGEYTFVAQLDGRTIFKETVKQNQIYQKSTGKSAFE